MHPWCARPATPWCAGSRIRCTQDGTPWPTAPLNFFSEFKRQVPPKLASVAPPRAKRSQTYRCFPCQSHCFSWFPWLGSNTLLCCLRGHRRHFASIRGINLIQDSSFHRFNVDWYCNSLNQWAHAYNHHTKLSRTTEHRTVLPPCWPSPYPKTVSLDLLPYHCLPDAC